MLPKMDGFDVCRNLRKENRSTPVIMLTAREEETDKVLGLELGADDYITKPFSMRELLARVKGQYRRNEMVTGASVPAPSGNRMELGRISIDPDQMVVYKDGRALELTQRSMSWSSSWPPTRQGVFPGGPHGARLELRGLCGRRAGRGRGRPPPAGKSGGRSGLASVVVTRRGLG